MGDRYDVIFNHSPDGVIEFSHEKPVLADVLAIGAVGLTYERTFSDHQTPICNYATDTKGLKTMINKSVDLLDHLHLLISALGVLLAKVPKGEVGEELGNLGWLINSLSELALEVQIVNSSMNVSLNTKNPIN